MMEHLKTRVLLVDDEREFLEVLGQRLEARKLAVITATSGDMALDVLADREVDVIVLDLAMPGMDGLETLQRIRQGFPEVEIIMLTGQGSIPSTVSALKLGAENFLEKPVPLDTLLTCIEEAHQKRVLLLQQKAKDEIEHILKSRPW